MNRSYMYASMIWFFLARRSGALALLVAPPQNKFAADVMFEMQRLYRHNAYLANAFTQKANGWIEEAPSLARSPSLFALVPPEPEKIKGLHRDHVIIVRLCSKDDPAELQGTLNDLALKAAGAAILLEENV